MSKSTASPDPMLNEIEEQEELEKNLQSKLANVSNGINDRYAELREYIEDSTVSSGDVLKDACLVKGREWKVYYERLTNLQRLIDMHRGNALLVYWTHQQLVSSSLVGGNKYRDEKKHILGIVSIEKNVEFIDNVFCIPTSAYIGTNEIVDARIISLDVHPDSINIDSLIVQDDTHTGNAQTGIVFGVEPVLEWFLKHALVHDLFRFYRACKQLGVEPPQSEAMQISVSTRIDTLVETLARIYGQREELSQDIRSMIAVVEAGGQMLTLSKYDYIDAQAGNI